MQPTVLSSRLASIRLLLLIPLLEKSENALCSISKPGTLQGWAWRAGVSVVFIMHLILGDNKDVAVERPKQHSH